MSMLGNIFPTVTTPTPVPLGGIRSYKIEVNSLEADVHRAADQTQDVFQGARAFFGANATNTLNQKENLLQEATAVNEKNFLYEPPAPDSNGIQSLSTALFASRFLARGRADNLQDQIGGQSAVSAGVDAGGNMSTALNELLQEEHVEQVIEDVKVKTYFDLSGLVGAAGNRRIDVILDEQVAESNLLNRQRQGYTTVDSAQKGDSLFDNPSTQFASSDGTVSQNNLVQDASSIQRSSSLIDNLVDLRRKSGTGSTGNTEVAISLNGDFVDGENTGRTRAVSFLESIQEQALVQQAQAGFDEMGNPTGNGGVSVNNAIQTMENVQIGDVRHVTNILI